MKTGNMKKIGSVKNSRSFVLLVMMILMNSCSRTEPAILAGFVHHSASAYAILMSGNSYDTISINKDGSFRFEKQIGEAGSYTFTIPGVRLFQSVWMENGKANELVVDAEKPEDITLKGDGEKELTFIQEQWASILNWKAPECNSFKEYVAAWEQFAESQNKEVEKVGNPVFTAYMTKQNAQQGESKKIQYSGLLAKQGKAIDSDADYNTYMQSIDLEDIANTKNNFTFYYLLWKAQCQTQSSERNHYDMMQVLAKEVKNPKVKDEFGLRLFKMYLSAGPIPDDAEEAYQLALGLTTPEVQKQVTQFYNNTIRPVGSVMSDFDMQTVEGQTVRFHTACNKKVVYIDIWSTWCGPCCKEIPYVAKLVEHYKDNPNIKFISISIDQNLKDWKEFLKKDNPDWEQYVIAKEKQKEFLKLMAINGIPRFMVFDEECRIITLNAPRPSSENMIEYLDNLIQGKK